MKEGMASGIDGPASRRASGIDGPASRRASGIDGPASPRASGIDGPASRRASGIDGPASPRASGIDGPASPRASGIDIVLPCLDEAAALPWVLARIPVGWRAIVVDNGSRDGSADIAQAAGALVVRESRRGFGAACHAGLLAATGEVVAFLDADGSLDPAQLPRVVDPVRSGDADLVLAARRPTQRGSWPWHLRLANRELARRTGRRCGVRLTDLGPMRAARREALLGLAMRDRRSGYPLETVIRAADAGWRIREVVADYLPRVGRSKVTGTPLGAARAVLDSRRVLAGAAAVGSGPASGPAPGVGSWFGSASGSGAEFGSASAVGWEPGSGSESG
jgi:hypothetical protein